MTCLASYQLVKSDQKGSGYVVSIDHLNFRVTFSDNEANLELIDLPLSLDGTGLTLADLIARFSIDGRPYADILKANRERLQTQGR